MILPVNEDQTINPYTNEYIFSKYIAEQICEYYRQYMNIINVRMSNVYGPTNLKRPDLIPTMVQSLINNNSCEIWNEQPIRDFIYVKDAAKAFIKLIETDFSGNINMGTGTSHSVREVREILEKISRININVLNKPVTGHLKFVCDNLRLRSLINWKPEYSLEEGLRETYELTKQMINSDHS
jgi:UDP-glucose 4-epimerase